MVLRKKQATGRSGNRRTKKLNDAAAREVDDKAREIAAALPKSTLEGHVQSAKLLVDLAEGTTDGDGAESTGPFRSQARDLEVEPEWKGDAVASEFKQMTVR